MGWSRFVRRKFWDEERAREIATYLEIETAENVARGMALEPARQAARRKLGNSTTIREEIYRMNSLAMLETLWQDLGYALRLLRRSPGFTLVAVLSLALGVGANTAVFSVVQAVLVRPLPYPQPDQLVLVGQQVTHGAVSISEYEFWKEHASSFATAAGYRGPGDRDLEYRGRHEWIKAMPVTADFFRTLGVGLALGREFNADETQARGPQAIVITDRLWRHVFDAGPEVIGRTVRLDDAATYIIAGVLPGGFWFPQAADAFVPLRPKGGVDDMGMNTQMIARLKPGVSLRQAEAEMPGVTENIRRADPGHFSREYRGLMAMPYQDWLVGDVRTNLLLLMGAVALLLLITCSNLASLLLARLAVRQKEIALRMALGSSRGRLLRQFLIENTLLTLAGGLAGFLGASGLLDAFVALIPFRLPASSPIRLDAQVLAFTGAMALCTGVIFTLPSMLSSARLDLQEMLKAGGRGTATPATRERTRNLLVVSEVALSMTLLVAAALLIESLYRIHQERLGFTPQGLITFWTPPERDRRRNGAALRDFEATLLERMRAVPGVRSVAGISVLPLTGQNNFPTERVGDPEHSIGGMEVRFITPGYFEVMSIPVIRGRPFRAVDNAAAPPVILVNETVAQRWWPQANPLGGQVKIGRFHGRDFPQIKDPPREVVGIVRDTKTVNLKDPPRPTVYIPVAQVPWEQGMNWVVRASVPAGLAGPLRQAIAEIDPRQRVLRMQAMEEIVSSTSADFRWNAWLFGIFAGLALLLTSIGVYGLLSFSVARRTSEFGTRMALGATRLDVLKLVLTQGIALIAIGLILGLGGALALTRSLATLLFGVRPGDPIPFVAVSVLLLAVGILASGIPARRATRVDPVVALRYE